MDHTNHHRAKLRFEIRQRRNAISTIEQMQAAELIAKQILSLIKPNQTIALYLANDGELSPHLVREAFTDQHINIALPVMHPFRKGYLNFQRIDHTTEMKANRFGIPEPKLSSVDTIPLENIDVILMPLVAFDDKGNRLGMGGGYFDRTLNKLKTMSKKPLLIGLAHDCQQVNELPFQSWDIPLNMILTPTQQIKVN